MEFKEELELLLNNFIITKENQREEYYKIKSKIKKLREFTVTKLGCDIICNSLLIKLEKIPSLIDNTYKIDDFDNRKDYVLFMLLIMFLEDKAKDEQFILSNLTNFIENISATIIEKEIIIDFKDYSTRKSLVDVLKYAAKLGMIRLIDGNDNLFKDSISNEVLYENTVISHFIIRQFKDDIFECQTPNDFLKETNIEGSLSKKRYFTYRSLLFYPNFQYSDFDEEIYNYFINYRNRIMADLDGILDGDLVIYKDVALLATVEKNNRLTFPNSRKSLHDIMLLVNHYIVNEFDTLKLKKFELEQLVKKIHEENKQYFNKEMKEMTINQFFKLIIESMEKFKLLKVDGEMYCFSPIIYLISGNYPKEEVRESRFFQLSLEME